MGLLGRRSLFPRVSPFRAPFFLVPITSKLLLDIATHPNIPGYVFEDVPTPLALGGVGVFIDESLDCNVIKEKSSD